MQKLHMRLSVEIDVTDKEFREIVERQLNEFGQVTDVEYGDLPRSVQTKIEIKDFEPCDWDDGGYLPRTWLIYDAVESGLYEGNDYEIRRKEEIK